ncbi:unnamed protein product [Cercopithifilaria johnstoni]|uniref:Uncharacterized protein n=1 Tax=Cercopithifilaria johnstoni TaxID=2874296 RepID=A0A8J2M1I8_9BILA|nr:unnamed protein product [Cercopithifilaria johnstoni]
MKQRPCSVFTAIGRKYQRFTVVTFMFVRNEDISDAVSRLKDLTVTKFINVAEIRFLDVSDVPSTLYECLYLKIDLAVDVAETSKCSYHYQQE